MISHRTIFLALFAATSSLTCQSVAAEEAKAVAPAAGNETQTVTLAAGTEAHLVLADAMSSQTAFTGQKFKLTLDQDIRASGRVAVARGTVAYGTVVNAKKSGSVGASGELNLRIDYLLVDGRRIPLFTAGVGKVASNHELGSSLLIAFFGPIGMLKKGEMVNFPAGTPVLAYIDATTQIPLPTVSTATAAPPESEPAPSNSSK